MRTSKSELDLTVARKGFNTVTLTVASLYLATHSVIVTLVGTVAASLLTCWGLWLALRERADDDREC